MPQYNTGGLKLTIQRAISSLATGILLAIPADFAHAISVPQAPSGHGQTATIEKIEFRLYPKDKSACPKSAILIGRIHTSKPGPIEYRIAIRGGAISGPWIAQASSIPDGSAMAVFKRTVQLGQNPNTQFKLLAGRHASEWTSTGIVCPLHQ